MLRKERQHGNSHVSREGWKRHHEQGERQSSERGQGSPVSWYVTYKEVGWRISAGQKAPRGLWAVSPLTQTLLAGRGQWTQASQGIPLVSLQPSDLVRRNEKTEAVGGEGLKMPVLCSISPSPNTPLTSTTQRRMGKEEEPQVEGHGRPAAAAPAHIQVGLIISKARGPQWPRKMPRRIQGTTPGPSRPYM